MLEAWHSGCCYLSFPLLSLGLCSGFYSFGYGVFVIDLEYVLVLPALNGFLLFLWRRCNKIPIPIKCCDPLKGSPLSTPY